MPSQLTRRQVAKGAAWAVPVIALATPAPAIAASTIQPCTPSGCPSGAFDNQWTATSTAIVPATGTTGVKSSWTPATGNNACTNVAGGSGAGTANNVAVGEGDPSGPGGYLVFSKVLCFTGGTRLTAGYSWLSYNTNNRAAYMQMAIEPYVGQSPSPVLGAAGSTLGPLITAEPRTTNTRGTVTGATYTVPVTGRYMLKIVWTFGVTPTSYSGQCNYGANDIGMYNLSLGCA